MVSSSVLYSAVSSRLVLLLHSHHARRIGIVASLREYQQQEPCNNKSLATTRALAAARGSAAPRRSTASALNCLCAQVGVGSSGCGLLRGVKLPPPCLSRALTSVCVRLLYEC
jgi:hypothetical protein